LKLIAVTSYLPFPQDNGDSVRILSMLQALGQSADLTVYAVMRPGSDSSDERRFRDALPDAEIYTFPLVGSAGRHDMLSRAIRLTRGIVGRFPPLLLTPWSKSLRDRLDQESSTYDAVVLVGEPAGLYVDAIHTTVIWDKANVFAAFWRESRGKRNRLITRVKASLMFPLARQFERRVLRSVDFTWVTSSLEAGRMQALYKVPPDAVIPSVIGPLGPPEHTGERQRGCVLWLSTFGYPPNWDGLNKFIREASPVFKAHGMILRVVGSGATPAQVRHLSSVPFVDYKGYVPDFAQVSEGVESGVVPLWAGAGLKLKTLTMMQMGIPVAATVHGIEGIDPDEALVVSDDATVLASKLAITSSKELHDVGMRGRRFVLERMTSEKFNSNVRAALDSHLG
jgi:hypothetical protein